MDRSDDGEEAQLHIGVACGGTGGHMLPGVQTARELAGRGHAVTLWLSGRGIESTVLSNWTGGLARVSAAGMPSGGILQRLLGVCRLASAVAACWWRMVRKGRPDVLLAMGSYSSFGPVCAARLLRVPVVLHEANAVPGKANGVLSRFASAVGVVFPSAGVGLSCARIVETGMPVRVGFEGVVACREESARSRPFTVLVMGGSQGAQAINTLVAGVAAELARAGVRLVHLTGPKEEQRVRDCYGDALDAHEVLGYCDDMAAIYGRVDLAVCRSGASSCAELAICGLPALLVPHPTSVRQHQQRNAAYYAEAGAADVMDQEELDGVVLTDYILALASDRERLARMGSAGRNLAVMDGASRLATLVEHVAAGVDR